MHRKCIYTEIRSICSAHCTFKQKHKRGVDETEKNSTVPPQPNYPFKSGQEPILRSWDVRQNRAVGHEGNVVGSSYYGCLIDLTEDRVEAQKIKWKFHLSWSHLEVIGAVHFRLKMSSVPTSSCSMAQTWTSCGSDRIVWKEGNLPSVHHRALKCGRVLACNGWAGLAKQMRGH